MRATTRQDSIFYAYFYNWFYAPDGSRAYFHVDRTSCVKETEQFQPIGVETNSYLIPFQEGELINEQDNFVSGTFSLASSIISTSEIEYFTDSTVYHIEENYKGCYQFPENSWRYVAFKMRQGNQERLGWIELKYFGSNTLRIRDWALQN